MSRAQQLKPGDVSLGQAYEFWKAFGAAGGTIDLVQKPIENPALMRGLVEFVAANTPKPTSQGTGIVYNAQAVSRILGIPCECSDPIPQAEDGEIVIYYGGWSLMDLRTSAAGLKRMKQQTEYDDLGWRAETGYYKVLPCVPGTSLEDWDEQVDRLNRQWSICTPWEPAPILVVATALLVHLSMTGRDMLKGDHCRGGDPPVPRGNRAVLGIELGHLCVSDWLPGRHVGLWLAGALKS